MKAKTKAKEKQTKSTKSNNVSKLPDQYPSKRNQESLVNLCSSIADMGIEQESDDDSTDDEAITSHFYMAKTFRPDPNGIADPSDDGEDVLKVRAHLEYEKQEWYPNKVYAISDGGADSCIVGKHAKIVSYTGRVATLVGYNPKKTRTEKVPIVTALIIVRSSSAGGFPVLLKMHECPLNEGSPITLLSEYQIREYGLVIDSVAKKHKSSHGKQGTQRFEVNSWVHIDFKDRGGFMGFEILSIEDGDEDKYETITITSPERWRPHKFQNAIYHTTKVEKTDNKESKAAIKGSETSIKTPPTPPLQ